jgi:FkbM family methyltransferase
MGHLPRRVWLALRGDSSSPSPFAVAAHFILNRVPGERYPVLPCEGPLKGYRMRVDWGQHRSFIYGTWEPEVLDAIRRVVAPGMTVLDIGAQSGFYTLFLSKLVGPEGTVVAFEPLPANFRLLEENIQLNRAGNVVLRREAVAAQSGEASLEFLDDHSHRTLVAGPLQTGESVGAFKAPAVSLDDWTLASGSAVHFVKMDVEGAEADVLRGARRVLETQRPRLVIEIHGCDSMATSPVVSMLDQLGYRIERLGQASDCSHILAVPGGNSQTP